MRIQAVHGGEQCRSCNDGLPDARVSAPIAVPQWPEAVDPPPKAVDSFPDAVVRIPAATAHRPVAFTAMPMATAPSPDALGGSLPLPSEPHVISSAHAAFVSADAEKTPRMTMKEENARIVGRWMDELLREDRVMVSWWPPRHLKKMETSQTIAALKTVTNAAVRAHPGLLVRMLWPRRLWPLWPRPLRRTLKWR